MHRAGRVIDEKKKRAIGFNPIHEACLRPQRMRNDPLPHRRIYIEIELLIFANDDRLLRIPCVDFTVLTITDPAAAAPFFLASPLFFYEVLTAVTVSVVSRDLSTFCPRDTRTPSN